MRYTTITKWIVSSMNRFAWMFFFFVCLHNFADHLIYGRFLLNRFWTGGTQPMNRDYVLFVVWILEWAKNNQKMDSEMIKQTILVFKLYLDKISFAYNKSIQAKNDHFLLRLSIELNHPYWFWCVCVLWLYGFLMFLNHVHLLKLPNTDLLLKFHVLWHQ